MGTPNPRFVGIGQCRMFDLSAEFHVVELRRPRRQTDLDASQILAAVQLCKGHHTTLFDERQRLDVMIAVAVIDSTTEGLPGQKVHERGEQRLAKTHRLLR